MKVLILCTGNSCRSQMAHGFLQSLAPSWTVESAGTRASGKLNVKAAEVMKETGIDISHHTSDSVEKYLDDEYNSMIDAGLTASDISNYKASTTLGLENQRAKEEKKEEPQLELNLESKRSLTSDDNDNNNEA